MVQFQLMVPLSSSTASSSMASINPSIASNRSLAIDHLIDCLLFSFVCLCWLLEWNEKMKGAIVLNANHWMRVCIIGLVHWMRVCIIGLVHCIALHRAHCIDWKNYSHGWHCLLLASFVSFVCIISLHCPIWPASSSQLASTQVLCTLLDNFEVCVIRLMCYPWMLAQQPMNTDWEHAC